jgi:hypothetical protein
MNKLKNEKKKRYIFFIFKEILFSVFVSLNLLNELCAEIVLKMIEMVADL